MFFFPYFAVGNGVELFENLFRQDNAVLFGGERMRGRQRIHCKRFVNII